MFRCGDCAIICRGLVLELLLTFLYFGASAPYLKSCYLDYGTRYDSHNHLDELKTSG